MIGALSVDEMHIMKKLEISGKKIVGFTDLGVEELASEEEATEAYVFMFTPFNSSGKIPIAYFFINGLDAKKRVQLIKTGIRMLFESSVRVASLTSDGPTTNITMMKLLGNFFMRGWGGGVFFDNNIVWTILKFRHIGEV